ncbi:hypothetical protein H5410_003750 [Solanum commersonii]|uniref:DUF4283 domain-containing protein n=1 Tax=Solanum commersonii TaxID=4109 RepID=A0A9J6B5T2_SOLCO|nr:hypothetical protein H5410_003750 [Solanum commersonii]
MILRIWELDFELNVGMYNQIPIWVRFPSLPMGYWSIKALRKLASAIGIPLYTDGFTTMWKKYTMLGLGHNETECWYKHSFKEKNLGGGVKVDHGKWKMKDTNRRLVAKRKPVKPQSQIAASEDIQEVNQMPTNQPEIDLGQRDGKQHVDEIATDTLIEEEGMRGNWKSVGNYMPFLPT